MIMRARRECLLPIALFAALTAWAEEPPDEAKELCDRGRDLRDARRFEEAAAAYERAITLLESGGSGKARLATALNDLGVVYYVAGRYRDAIAPLERALGLRREADEPRLTTSLNNLAATWASLGQHAKALPLLTEALELDRRRHPGDHMTVAHDLVNVAATLDAAARHREAVERHREAVAMLRRLFDGDHALLASALHNMAHSLGRLGRHAEALPLEQEALAIRRRLFSGDHGDIASTLGNFALRHRSLGRLAEALAVQEEACAMSRRIFRRDHPDLARSINNLGLITADLGRHDEALPLYREALAMWERVFQGDHADVGLGLTNTGAVLVRLGRPAEALAYLEEAVAMQRRMHSGDHAAVVVAVNALAINLRVLGRHAEGLAAFREALGMVRRLFPGDHPDVAKQLGNVGAALNGLDRHTEALPLHEEALAMRSRLFTGDHPMLATSLNNLAATKAQLGRGDEAVALLEQALAMRTRMHGDSHPESVNCLTNLAATLDNLGRVTAAAAAWAAAAATGRRIGWRRRHYALVALGRHTLRSDGPERAIPLLVEAVEHVEALNAEARPLDLEGGARYAAEIRRRGDPFPVLAEALVLAGKPADALACLERGRARRLLDLVERGRNELLDVARDRARARKDTKSLERIEAVHHAVAEAEVDVLQRAGKFERARAEGVREAIRDAREAETKARRALEKALRDRLRVLRDVLPETRPLMFEEIAALLAPGERMLYYGLGEHASFVFLVKPEGVEAVRLQENTARVTEAVAAHAKTLAKPGGDRRTGSRLFEMVVPEAVRSEVKEATRVYVLPHGPLHSIPFETLGPWIEDGPPIAYGASGSVLAWLKRRRAATPRPGASLVAVGDPDFGGATEAPWPKEGVLVREVRRDGQAASAGMRRGDVLVAYGGRKVDNLASLIAAIQAVPADAESVEARLLRDGDERVFALRPGKLGVVLAREAPSVAGPALTVRGVATRGSLPPLPGTREEVEAVRKTFPKSAQTVVLFGTDATEERLFAAAGGARFLHLATHGIVDEADGASFSGLALARPRVPVPGDDGFLTLRDLLERWRGRLDGTQLVVLSACESMKGRLEHDEGMLALPSGFLFAGAPAVVASLWKVDDRNTARLMADLYRRLLAEGAPGPCEALHAARRALRKTHPDPYYWGAFVYVGAP